MADLSNVKFNARVYGSDRGLVGYVDAVEDGADGERIRLRTSSCRFGSHDRVPATWVESVADGVVTLYASRAEACAALEGGAQGRPNAENRDTGATA